MQSIKRKIREEEMYDGFYTSTTNLEDDDIKSIIEVSERRCQIEEWFRIMKQISRQDSISA